MAYLVFENHQNIELDKRFMSVGSSDVNDIQVQSRTEGTLFTLQFEEGHYEILPMNGKIKVNGASLSKKARLKKCVQVAWDQGRFIYLDQKEAVLRSDLESQVSVTETLKKIFKSVSEDQTKQEIQYQILEALVEMTRAEMGYFLVENRAQSEWEVAAMKSHPKLDNPIPTKRKIFSNTLLKDAISSRQLVYVENIVGHAYSKAESIQDAKIFSAACFPLMIKDRVIGAVFLSSHSPGRSIQKETLDDARLIANLSSYLLVHQKPKKLESNLNSSIVFHPEKSPIKFLMNKIEKVAPTTLSVLIQGETGSGKELIAKEIHLKSDRSKGPFVAINCAAIPSTLLESILFGHEKGAFTGATQSQKGKFQLASGGTLFLDEVADLPLDLQAKLLRVIQEQKVDPLGASESISIDVRVISATHQDLKKKVSQKRFRDDLYYRLDGITVEIPSLKDRKVDIMLLSEFFLKRLNQALEFDASAIEKLESYSWPGNVRELEQVMMRSAVLSEGGLLSAEDIELGGEPEQPDTFEVVDLKVAQNRFTHAYVLRAIHGQADRKTAAKKLGISERTLYRILSQGPTDSFDSLS